MLIATDAARQRAALGLWGVCATFACLASNDVQPIFQFLGGALFFPPVANARMPALAFSARCY